MTIPLSRKALGIERTILSCKEAILKRLRMRAWVVREGRPNMRSLPDDGAQAVSVWVFPTRTASDDSGQATNWHSETFATAWLITVVTPDTGTDPHSQVPDRIITATAEVLESLTKTTEGTYLDGSVNWSDNYRAEYGVATVGGNRNALVAAITLQAHHPIFPNRNPPGTS